MKGATRGGNGKARLSGAMAAFAVLLAGISAISAESIYYQTGKDGTIRLTNAPSTRSFHTYLTTGRHSGSEDAPPGLYGEQIRRAARNFDIDPGLVRAIIATESNFDPRAVSPKGARGLMQLMPATARRFGVKDIFDPAQNISGGVRYLRHLLDLFEGDLVLALAAYNAGEGVVQDRGAVPNYRETQDYVDRVLARYGHPGRSARVPVSRRLESRPAPGTRIYKAVSGDGALVFSDSPIPKPVDD
jgi:soluble lytic murein transglycosylase-like protein